MGAFLKTLLAGIGQSLLSMVGGGVGSVWNFTTNILGKSLQMAMDFHKEGIAYAREMGMSLKESQAYTETLAARTKELALNYGLTAEQVRELQRAVSDATDRNIMMTNEDANRYAQMAQTVGIGTSKAFTTAIVNTMGGQLSAVEGAVAKAYATAAKSGLNAAKYSEKLAQNLSIANKFAFRDGVEGVGKMVALSEKLGVNVQTFANAADQFTSLENAIGGSAKLNMLGGAAGIYGSNPLEMMYEANYSPEDFSERMSSMVKGMATFNVAKGQAVISPVEMDRMRAMADALHVDVGELTSMAKSQATVSYKEAKYASQIQALAGSDQMKRDYILNKSQVDAGGKVYITGANGEKMYLDQLASNSSKFQELYQYDNMSDKDILEKSAKELQDLNTKLAAIQTAMEATAAQPMIGVIEKDSEAVTKFGPTITDGFSKAVSGVTETAGKILHWLEEHGVIDWAKQHPMVAGGIAIGGYALVKGLFSAIGTGISSWFFGRSAVGGASNIGKMFTGIKNVAVGAGKGLWNAGKWIVSHIKSGFSKIPWGKIGSGIKNAANAIANGAKSAARSLGNAAKSAAQGVKNAWGKIPWGKMGDALKNGFNSVKTALTNGAKALRTSISNLATSIKNGAKGLWSKVTDGTKAVGKNIKGGATKVTQGVKGAYARAGEATRNLKSYTTYVKENAKIAKESGSLWKNVRSGQIFKAPAAESGYYSRGLKGVNNFVNRTGLGKIGASTKGAQTAVNIAKGAKVASKLAKIGGTAGVALAIEAADFGVNSMEKHGVINGAKDTVTYRNFKRSLAGAEGAALGATVGSVVPVIGTAVGAAVGGAIGMGKEYIDQYHEFKAEEAKKGHDVNFLDYMKRDVEDFKKEFSQGLHNTARFINDKSYRDEVMGNMKKKFKDGLNALGEDLKVLPKEIGDWFKDAGEWIYDGAKAAKDGIANFFNGFSDVFEAMLRLFMVDFKTDRPKILIETIKQFINHPIATIKGAATAVVDMAKAKYNEIKERFTSFFNFVRDLPSNLMKGLSKTFGDNLVGDLFAKAASALDFSGNKNNKAQPKSEVQKKVINEKSDVVTSKSSDSKKTVVNYTNVKYENGSAVAKDVKSVPSKNGTFQTTFGSQEKQKWASPVYVVTEKSAENLLANNTTNIGGNSSNVNANVMNGGNLGGSTVIGNKLMSVANNKNTFSNGGIVGGNTTLGGNVMNMASSSNSSSSVENNAFMASSSNPSSIENSTFNVINKFANGGVVGGNTTLGGDVMNIASTSNNDSLTLGSTFVNKASKFADGGVVNGPTSQMMGNGVSPSASVGEKLMSVAEPSYIVTEKHANDMMFSDGGIVDGDSYSGDKILARLNSGEVVLNVRQQETLYNKIVSTNSVLNRLIGNSSKSNVQASPEQLDMLRTKLSTVNTILSGTLPKSDIAAKPVGEREFIRIPNESKSIMQKHGELKVGDINVKISGEIKLNGGNSFRNFDIKELLNDISFVSSLKEIIKQSISHDINGGRQMNDIATFRGMPANTSTWGHLGSR